MSVGPVGPMRFVEATFLKDGPLKPPLGCRFRLLGVMGDTSPDLCKGVVCALNELDIVALPRPRLKVGVVAEGGVEGERANPRGAAGLGGGEDDGEGGVSSRTDSGKVLGPDEGCGLPSRLFTGALGNKSLDARFAV